MIERVPRLFGILQSTGHCSLVLFGSSELSSLLPVKSIIYLYFSLSADIPFLQSWTKVLGFCKEAKMPNVFAVPGNYLLTFSFLPLC